MRAWLLPKLGSIDAIQQADVPAPTPAAGEVVLRLLYAALNPADRYLADGQYPARPELPHILGRDGIGIVEAVGDGVTGHRPGDVRVLVRSDVGVERPGTFAEMVAVPAESLVPQPKGWTLEQSAGATLVYLTAWQALSQWEDFQNSRGRVLITGASGGVGVACIQLARALGHEVIAMSRSPEKTKVLRQLGAADVLDPNDTQWRKKLAGRKIDLAIDNIGGAFFGELLGVMADHGRVSCVGRLAGPVPEFNTAALFFGRLRIGGVAVGSYTAVESQAAWRQVESMLNDAHERPLVDSIHPFDQLPAAFAKLKAGPMGKVLLKI